MPTIPVKQLSNDEEGFLFEVGSPPRSEGSINGNEQAIEMFCTIKDIVQDLKDFTSRECTRLASRMDSLEQVVENLGGWLESTSDVALPDLTISTPQTQVLFTQRPGTSFEDRSNFVTPSNQSGGEDTYSIPPVLVASCLQCCKSQRHLAGCLAGQVFPTEEQCKRCTWEKEA